MTSDLFNIQSVGILAFSILPGDFCEWLGYGEPERATTANETGVHIVTTQ